MFGHHCSDVVCKFSTTDFYNACKSMFFIALCLHSSLSNKSGEKFIIYM